MYNPLTKEESKFLINLIKSGNKTKAECINLLNEKFNRTMHPRNLAQFARRNKLVFKDVQPDAYTEKEEAVLKGLWLVNAGMERRSLELPTRGARSMQSKLLDFKMKKKTSEALKKQIKGEIQKGGSLKDIAKKHGVDQKYINELAGQVNKESVEFKDIRRWKAADLDDLFDDLSSIQKKLRLSDSEQSHADLTINTKAKYVALTVLSDFHLENINTDLDQLRADFKIIKETPNFFAGFNGDLIDNFAVGPHKEGVIEAALPPRQARMLAGKLFEYLKDKMLWMVLGCHDAWDKNYADYDLPQHIARKIMVPYLGAGGDINLKINKGIEYFIHSRHKYRGSSGLVNGTGCCKKVLVEIDPKFDVVAVSHNHFSEIKLEHYLGKERCYIRTGSYKREDRYSKMLGFRSNEFNIQIPVIILNTEKKEMKVVSGISNAAQMLKALNKSGK